jgi:MFS family permease
MVLVGSVTYLDRLALGILLPQIKLAFALSDTELGMLAGPAFALFYGLLGVPMGVLADRRGRRPVIMASLGMLGVTTVLFGMAGSFVQLLCARVVTGIAAAGINPSANALLSDAFPMRRRAGVLSTYAGSINIGLLLAFFGGGWVAQLYGWRVVMMFISAFVLLAMLVVGVFVREPSRSSRREAASAWRELVDAAGFLGARRSFRWMVSGMALASIASYGGIAFIPSLLVRSHHLSLADTGLALALLVGIVGFMGTMLAGIFADWLGQGDPRWGMYVACLGLAGSLPFSAIFYLSHSVALALSAAAVPTLLGSAFLGTSYAAVQALTPTQMRGRSAALFLLVPNLVGPTLGPQLVGLASDLLRPEFGVDSLRYALTLSIIPSALAVGCFWQVSRSLPADVAAAEQAG